MTLSYSPGGGDHESFHRVDQFSTLSNQTHELVLISRNNQKGVRHRGYITKLHLQVICLSRCTQRASLWVRPSWTLPTVLAKAPGWTTRGPGLDGHQVLSTPH